MLALLQRKFANPWVRVALGVVVAIPTIALVTAIFYYVHDSRMIDDRLKAGAFADSMNIYASPLTLSVGDGLSPDDVAAELQAAGYVAGSQQVPGTFSQHGSEFILNPPRTSESSPVRVLIDKGRIASIRNSADGRSLLEYHLGTPLLSSISSHREKRQVVTFAQVPTILVDAVISIEDKRFFQHNGLDLMRMGKAAYIDLKDGRKEQGASTLTMQLVRGLWLEPEKRWTRKVSEALMTLHLEQRWSKQQIFEAYANQVYLGRDRSYAIRGFGEGARALFGKDLRQITLPEAALLAGIVQRPSYFNAFRYPERAAERRNLVLTAMAQNGYITEAQRDQAVGTPVRLAAEAHAGPSDAPYFIDLVSDELQSRDRAEIAERDVYTTLDLNLQRAADEALATGLAQVDKLVARKNGGAKLQGALIAIDPHTGQIRAVSGGRDYAISQLDRVLSKRPPGSVFKPFVYAAALNSAVDSGGPLFTLASTVADVPTTFTFDGTSYRPNNFHQAFYGTVTLRQALAHSMNVAAVKVAEGVGYDRVVAMAHRAGINDDIKPTPSVALGAYDVTPLEIAGAYTLFSNGGVYVKPSLVSAVRDVSGETVRQVSEESRQALDPRVAYLMVSALEEVMRSGTAAGVRARGFTLPAAGKTGTSHDGWFAGFTSKLLCVVWVGYDDYRELNLEGARSALPIWTEFMKRASHLAGYRDAVEFPVPAGVAQARICSKTGKLAAAFCPSVRSEYFVDGSAPTESCDLHQFGTPPDVNIDQPVATHIPGSETVPAPSAVVNP